jgi:Carboxypeptidase regulatory-like domain
MKRSHVGIAALVGVGLIAAAAAVWFFLLRAPAPTVASVKPAPAQAGSGDKPAAAEPTAQGEALPESATREWEWDRDPVGTLRLDGQVVDATGEPVGDAMVMISTVPPAKTRSQADGSFHFDKLVGRTFSVSGRAGAMSGTTRIKLTRTSDPVVLRLRAGVTVAVLVNDEAGKPVRGAVVSLADEELFGDDALTATTDAAGKARLVGVESGWTAISARAAGYAEGQSIATIGEAPADGQPAAEVTIVLRRGVAVAGKVVDEAGEPIASASVHYETPGMQGFPTGGNASATTDARGEFRFAMLAPGQTTFTAFDGEHAKGFSKAIAIADQPVRDVVIVMKEGGTVSGAVVSRDGAEVPFATLRIAPHPDAEGGMREAFQSSRRMASDEHGRFEIKGLPRARLQLRAEGELATSAITEVSLAEVPRRDQLRVVLDVEGSIAGVVVDEHGDPVPEVSVSCFPDITRGARLDSFAMTGSASATTDGSGAFVVRGLAEGEYRLATARSGGGFGGFGSPGKSNARARTGDRNVRLVLASPGRVLGKIATGDGKPPELASVIVTGHMPVTTRNGAFSVGEIEPGRYDVTVRGPEFAERTLRDVEVKAGEDKDVGTITVVRGRRITGTVVDSAKRPVAGAKIRLGEYLISSGSSSDDGATRSIEEMQGVLTTTSDAKGTFSLGGLSALKTLRIAAETAAGRSLPVEVPAGEGDAAPVVLQLRAFGSIAGTVTIKGKPAGKLSLSAGDKGAGMNGIFGSTNADGTYLLERIPEGEQTVMVMRTGGMSMSSTRAQVTVTGGKRAKLDIDIKGGDLTLTTPISALPNQVVNAAQVFLFEGTVELANGKALMERFNQGAIGMQFWFGGGAPAPSFKELAAGSYSACAIPITGEMTDPQFMQRLQQNTQMLAVYCKPVKLTAAPLQQSLPLALPAMTPLPAPPAQ